jgi:hypothetical protein
MRRQRTGALRALSILMPMSGPIRILLLAAALLAAPALPGQALASVGSIYGDYSKDGQIDGCSYSPSDLNGALGSVPTDVAQYDPRFVDALNKALSDRSCGKGAGAGAPAAATGNGAAGSGQKTAADGSPAPGGLVGTDVALSGSPDFSSDRGFPAALGVLAGLVALILLGTGALALARRNDWHLGGAPMAGLRSTLSDYYWGMRDQLGR